MLAMVVVIVVVVRCCKFFKKALREDDVDEEQDENLLLLLSSHDDHAKRTMDRVGIDGSMILDYAVGGKAWERRDKEEGTECVWVAEEIWWEIYDSTLITLLISS